MERLRDLKARLFGSVRSEGTDVGYQPLEGGSEGVDGEAIEHPHEDFSWTDYFIFMFLGIAMLWAWNMFLAAAPYFQHRFASNERLLRNFQSAELSVSTVGSFGSIIVLTKLQARASYPKRIMASLAINLVVFVFLALSTRLFLNISAGGYFAFLMIVVLCTSLAAALCQNGLFAYVSGFGREEYTQAIMAGQGIAGVLPCIAQIISVLSVPERKPEQGSAQESSTSAFAYFLTATVVSTGSLVAFVHLRSRHGSRERIKHALESDESEPGESKEIPLTRLLRKLFWIGGAVFLTFAITMFFPVFTGQILSVRDPISAPRIFHPSSFIPLAFLFWNAGDLIGRLLPAIPALSLTARPRVLFVLAISRVVFIPMYMLCNVGGKGAKIESDFFYLLVIQVFYGISNGYVGSSCMIGFVEWVDPEEREAAGGFMSLCLVAGLTAGSFLSFLAAGS